MEYIENYKRLFDMVSDLPDGDGYDSLMSPVERKEPVEDDDMANCENTVGQSNENVLAPTVSGAAEVSACNDVVAGFDMPESQRETVNREMMPIRNGAADEQTWDRNANRVKEKANETVKKFVEQSKYSSATPGNAASACSEPKRKIAVEPEFMKVREIQPVETVNPNLSSSQVKSTSDGLDDSRCDSGVDAEALQKCRSIVDKMAGMYKYTDSYKNRCAGLLCKYMELPKTQFESLCSIMESVNK